MDVKVQDQNSVDLLFQHQRYQTFCVEVSKRRINVVRYKRGELWRDRTLILHRDNAPAHPLLLVLRFLTRRGISA
jgi:hypothetical protein